MWERNLRSISFLRVLTIGGGLYIIKKLQEIVVLIAMALLLKGREMSHACEHNFISPSCLDGYLHGEDLHQLAN